MYFSVARDVRGGLSELTFRLAKTILPEAGLSAQKRKMHGLMA